jgi:DNA-directed RNA polymerase subunit F
MSNDSDMLAALEAAELKLQEAKQAVYEGQQRGRPSHELAELTNAKNRAWKHLEALRQKFRRR